jgi:hypothetical protein
MFNYVIELIASREKLKWDMSIVTRLRGIFQDLVKPERN